MAMGGSIGTALFINIGGGLAKGGPLSLLLGFTIYALILSCVNNCIAEMTVLHPVPGGFIRMAGKGVDDAFGFMAGWNFFLYEAYPRRRGGSRLHCFLLHDAFGFRHWRDPGPLAEYLNKGNLGRFEGFLGSPWMASFTTVGPEYITLIAAETKHPRTYVKKAFQTVFWRFPLFFITATISVGILVPRQQIWLVHLIIAMQNLRISGLPHVTNALLVTIIFSAGNTYMYCASRSVPIYCVLVTICFPLLSLLQLGDASSQVLTWLTNILTAGGLINYFTMAVTYVFFCRACKAQGVDRTAFPYYGRLQPYAAWVGVIGEGLIIIFFGYGSFWPWDISTFFTNYTMVIFAFMVRPLEALEADLLCERVEIDFYERSTHGRAAEGVLEGDRGMGGVEEGRQ
ncbi:amino acid permease-domain-containing protein [Aspergillus desertorum]